VGGVDLFDQGATASSEGAWSVSEVTRQARLLIESGLRSVWVRGEVTGLKAYRSGHWYFTLRDAGAQVRCVMWRADNRRLPGPPDDGTEIFVEARPTVWEERGEFRLTVKQLIPTAAGGLWQLQLERAKAALERDGLLDPAGKRPLPPYPARIAVVTSPDGAALRDILSVLRRRWPVVDVLVVPTRVQGDGAEDELCGALALVNRLEHLDLVIVGRGGGSQEDLWAFNSERVARAVAAVRVPTISAVGHETDVALTDLVADVRAPTPSVAAETAVPDAGVVGASLDTFARRLARTLTGQLTVAAQRLARTGDRLGAAAGRGLADQRHRMTELAGRLESLSPLRVLARGYAVARGPDGDVLKRVAQFVPGRRFRLTVSDGDVDAQVRGGQT
jgi:exodeoxyribonuclease VII large subunit